MRTFILAILLTGVAVAASAQRAALGNKVPQKILRPGKASAVKKPQGPKAVAPALRAPFPRKRAEAPAEVNISAQEAPLKQQSPFNVGQAAARQAEQSRLDLERQLVATLKQRQESTRKLWEESFQTGIGRSVLFAPIGNTGTSVSVVKTQYRGKEEIFGVIATHVLPESTYTYNGSLQKQFHVQLKKPDGTEILLPAQVVQISPQSMLDISLVKFSPQAEALVKPLEISPQAGKLKEKLFSYGFADHRPVQVERTVEAQSFISQRTDINIEGDRRGFCGSPLLNAENKITGFHTGTVEGDGPIADVSYGTHAWFVNVLVEGYHNGGQATYDVVLQNKHLVTLNIDEYISRVEVLDEHKTPLAHKKLGKFSQSALEQLLSAYPQAAYLRFDIHKAAWKQVGEQEILYENRSEQDPTFRQYDYALHTP